MKPCPFCGQQPTVGDKFVDIGGAICRRIFFVACLNLECKIKPSIYVGGECGYKHLDEHTNQEAETLSRLAWEERS